MDKQTEYILNQIVYILKENHKSIKNDFPNIESGYIQAPFNFSDLEDLEKEYKIKIPVLHKQFIEKYSPKRFHIMFTDFYGIEALQIELKDFIPEELIQEGYLPFAGSSGNYYCLDMKSDTDKVYFFNHDKYNISEANLTFTDFFKEMLDAKLEHDKNNM
jgi:hypothetical protein